MSEIILQVKTREIEKESNSELRNRGFIPAVLYGPETENLNLSVSEKELDSFLKSGHRTKPFVLKLDSSKSIDNVLLHELQRDSLRGKFSSVDFYQFDASKKIKVSIPIVLQGKAPTQDFGGVVVLNMNEIEIECLPVNIPNSVLVDVSVLSDFDATIYVKDLKFPVGVSCHIDSQTSVVSVSEPLKDEIPSSVAPVEAAVVAPVEAAAAEDKSGKSS
ncbi:MAG: hypothetical protein A2570_00370 [Candidatus Brennerbacteria bacterium RIFOXYD1_FULL_41_16]|uniref:Large ribosomal subunit protein bL25 n=1 Tax=Candidatus Brennerbacteria bacterium RIFOXYD1_FULL_41_16 TaxID=1797529 RepID=A0A1G1XL83_9BACT|nr:MAG: hypothetical protein A2570_00370 [Candidatus Brennerbacteria bacterium RIFOXYD1_FULL_41_16]